MRSYNGIVNVVPGVMTNLNDVVTTTSTTQFPIHGGRNNEGRMTVDGLNIGNPPGGNQPPAYIADVGNAQEVTFTTAGGLGESETAGLVMNIVPKTGGNSHSGAVFYSVTGEALEGSNFTPALQAAGLQTPLPLTGVYDLNGSFGGPIKKDKVWFFGNARIQGSTRGIANIYYNLNAGDPTKWRYLPADGLNGRPLQTAYSDRTSNNGSMRVTWQVTPRNKISGFWDEQANCPKCTGLTTGITDPPRVSPEARGTAQTAPLRVPQVTWASPVTSKLLLDAGFGGVYYGWGNFERNPNPTHDLINMVEQCAPSCANNGNAPAGLVYRSQDYGTNTAASWNWKASMAYVTGANSLKIGYQGTLMTDYRTWGTNSQNLSFRVNNLRPQPDHRARRTVAEQRRRRLARVLRAGSVDAQPPDPAGGAAIRSFDELVSRTDGRAVDVPPGRDPYPAHRRRQLVQGHHAAHGHGVGRLRQRQDGRQGEHRQVPRRRGRVEQLGQREPHAARARQRRPVRAVERHAVLDRREPQLRAGLQPGEPRGPEPGDDGQHRLVRGDLEPELRAPVTGTVPVDQQLRSGAAQRVGRARVRLDARRVGAAAAHGARVDRSRVHAAVVSRLHGARTTRRSPTPT